MYKTHLGMSSLPQRPSFRLPSPYSAHPLLAEGAIGWSWLGCQGLGGCPPALVCLQRVALVLRLLVPAARSPGLVTRGGAVWQGIKYWKWVLSSS